MTPAAMLATVENELHDTALESYFYDWANSAFMTTVVAAVFPTYFLVVASELNNSSNRCPCAVRNAFASGVPRWGVTTEVAVRVRRAMRCAVSSGAICTPGVSSIRTSRPPVECPMKCSSRESSPPCLMT